MKKYNSKHLKVIIEMVSMRFRSIEISQWIDFGTSFARWVSYNTVPNLGNELITEKEQHFITKRYSYYWTMKTF